MHECSAVEQLVKIAEEKAIEANAVNVHGINIVVGELTGYMEESLCFYFKILSKDTILSGAMLCIRYIPAELVCTVCGKNFIRERFTFECPDCGTVGEMTKKGTEFYIDTMEVD